MDDDAELAAIRARLTREHMESANAPEPASAPEPVLEDLDEGRLEAFIRGHENVVIDCWAPWCGPCRIVGPIIEELSRDLAGRVAFGKLNVDMNPTASQAFGIQSIPTLLVFRQAALVERIVGAVPKPRLSAMLDRHFAKRPTRSPGPRRL